MAAASIDAQLDPSGTTAVVVAAAHPDFTGATLTWLDVATGESSAPTTIDDEAVFAFRFDLATGGDTVAVITPRGVEIWHRTAGLVATLDQADTDVPTAVQFVDEEQIAVAFAGPDERLQLYDTGSWRSTRQLPVPVVLRSLAVDPSGRTLVGGGEDGGLARWDVESWQALPTWRADVGTIVDLAVADDGSVVAVGLASAFAVVDPSGATIGAPMPVGRRIAPVSFTQDDLGALVPTVHGLRRIGLDHEEWEQTACAVAGRELDHAEWADHFGTQPYRPICS